MKKFLISLAACISCMAGTDLVCAQVVSNPVIPNAASMFSSDMSASVNSQLPFLYKSLVPFNSAEHRQLMLPKAPVSYAFAAQTDVIPLLVSEVPYVVRHYPIVFLKDSASSSVTPVALVGRGDGKNRFVDADGRWLPGVYVPAWVRRYPFALMSGPQGEGVLAIDVQSPLFAVKADGQLLVDSESKPTPVLQKIIEFQKEFHSLSQLTEQVVRALVQADVLQDGAFSIKNADAEKPINVQGFMVINESKLKALKIEQLDQLLRADALGLAYAQLFSMGNLSQVVSNPAH